MRLPLRIVPNGLGELSDIKDVDDRYIAHCVESSDARALMNCANGRDSLRAELDRSHEEIAKLKAFLRRFSQTAEWHDERKRLMGSGKSVEACEV